MYKFCALIGVLIAYVQIGVASSGSPNAPTLLSLREAVLLSLRFNTTICSAEIDRISQRFGLRVAQNQFELQYNLSTRLNLLQNNDMSASYSVFPSVSWQSRYGTNISLAGVQSRANGLYSSSTELSIKQPLLRGAGRDVVEAGLRNRYDREEIDRLDLRDRVGSAINEVVRAYRALILANNGVEIQKRQLEEARRNMHIIKTRIQAGRIASTQGIQEELQFQQIEFALESRLNEQDKARQNLLEAIGLDPNIPIEVPSDVDVSHIDMPNQEETIRLALVNNRAYQTQLISLRASKRNLHIQQNNQKWQLDLVANVGLSGHGQHVGESFVGKAGGTLTSQIGVSLNIPIQDYQRKKSLLDAHINVHKTELLLADARRKLITEVKNALFSLRSLIKRLEISEQKMGLANRVYKIEKQKQLAGRSTSLDVSTSQNNYISAQNDFIQTKIDYLNQLDALNLSLGLILKHWDIELHH